VGPIDSRLLVRRQSRHWGEVLRPLNKTSDNALTRMLYLNLGVPAMAVHPTQTTAELAAQAVQRWFEAQGIDAQGLVMDNGSGLSRSERISPLQMARMLQVAHAAPYASDLMMSLPTVGVDGSMRNRLKQSPATAWSRLKTGTLRNVVALAGYVPDPQGQLWAVALMINHERANRGRPVLDALVDHWAREGMGPPLGAVPATIGPLGNGP
jgi:D-alanyl-D-alanine carboxypeptidase/D-alanyl-D-alanine-endopeptidase (penicillin-binding protein 4)